MRTASEVVKAAMIRELRDAEYSLDALVVELRGALLEEAGA